MKAVLFDMDGVIFDSERVVLEGWQTVARRHGFSHVEIPFHRCIGTNSAVSKKIFLDFYGEDFEYELYHQECSTFYHERCDGGKLPQKPGVRELLVYLKENGYYTAIASSTRRSLVEQQVIDAGLRPFFDCIVGGDMVTKSKPEPDIFLKAAEAVAGERSDIYVIEDSFNGIRAAQAAGMFPIMVPDMVPPDEEMKQKAGIILQNLLEVKDFLAQREQ